MINNDRIVPVMATDLITLYGVILKMDSNNSSLAKVNGDAEGNFAVTSASTPLLASEPVKSCDFAAAVTSASLYFVPSYDFEGFSLAGVKTTASGDVDKDGNTLYLATLATNAITITKVGL